MSLYKDFETDQEIENTGIWIEASENEDGSHAQFKLSRMGKSNKKYQKATERVARPFRKQIDLGTLPVEKVERLNLKIFAETIVLDWKNVYDREGNKMAFNKKNCEKLLHDLPELYASLEDQATNASLFRKEEQEAEAKN